MSLKLLIGLSILTAAPARAERSIHVEVAGATPFEAAELTAALRVRLPAEGAQIQIRVSPTTEGVRIEARGNVRELRLRGLRGAAAARLVALAANDLLLDDLATVPEPALAPPSLTRSRTQPHRPTTIGVFGAAAAWEHVLGGLAIDLAIPRDGWLVTIDAGGHTLVDGPLRLTAGVIRIAAGVRFGWFEVRTGATLAPLIVSNGDGDRTILAGAGASARVRVPITAGLRAVLAGGADVFATRTTYVMNGMSTLATPRLAPWLAAGVEVTR